MFLKEKLDFHCEVVPTTINIATYYSSYSLYFTKRIHLLINTGFLINIPSRLKCDKKKGAPLCKKHYASFRRK